MTDRTVDRNTETMILTTKISLFILFASLILGLTWIYYEWMNYIVSAFYVISTACVSWAVADFLVLYLSPCRRVYSKNKAVFITGCTSGFGLLLAKRLYDEGFVVFAGCRKPESPGGMDLKSSCPSDRLHIVKVDVNSDDDVRNAVQQVTSKLPEGSGLWALVNNAGYARGTVVEISSMETLYDHLEVNAAAPYRVTRAFLPLLRKTKGSRVIVMSSIGSRVHFPFLTAYTLSKMALVGFAESLRRELKPWNIKVICLEPALYKTRLADIESNSKALENEWNTATEALRKEYGEGMFRKIMELLKSTLGFAFSDIDYVVGAMRNAVVCVDYPVRPVIAPVHWRLFFTVGGCLPREIIDLAIKMGEVILKKLYPDH